MTSYDRKSVATTPERRTVLVSTVRHRLTSESMNFAADAEGNVAGWMHLHRVPHGAGEDLDAAHEQLVSAVEAGTIPLQERDPTPTEIAEAFGELILLDKMADDQANDDDDEMIH